MFDERRPLAIYIHIPFCARHCAYCDFNTYVEKAQSPLVTGVVDALCKEIALSARENHGGAALGERPVETIFFGGGTPTFLTGSQLARLVQAVFDYFPVEKNAEITSEANPGSSDAEKFAAMRAAGFNRLSIGIQSFDDRLLVALDRFHTVEEAERAVAQARQVGFDNLNLDLMFGLPHQDLTLWRASLQKALALNPKHLSLYALTLEPGTRFERMHAGGKLNLPDEDTELAMYEECIQMLESAGMEHYEVSNFAFPGFRCRHNQVYWRNEEYLGIGPGAVSYINGCRWKRERLPGRYLQKIASGTSTAVETECLGKEAALGETMMLGLRMREGISLQHLQHRFGIEPSRHFAAQISRFEQQKLIITEDNRLRLTYSGLLIANTVLAEFLPD